MSLLDVIRANRKAAEPPPEPPAATEPDEKADLPSGNFRMFSNVLDAAVDVVFPDGTGRVAVVDGVKYGADEISNLMARHLDPADLRAVHEVKRAFEGKITE